MGPWVRTAAASSALALGLGGFSGVRAQGNGNEDTSDFGTASVVVEINATVGDIGIQALFNADAWKDTRIYSPNAEKVFDEQATGSLAQQGLTENAFESAEPLCTADPGQPDARVVPLSEFIGRFPEGNYSFIATTIEGEKLQDRTQLTHDLPAAPKILGFDGTTITWQAGTDLGKCQDDDLVSGGTIPDPASVELVGWEVTVEPAGNESADPLRIYSVQLPAGVSTMVTVPSQFVDSYLADGVTAFKVEIGAIEASGNRTFSEENFDLRETQPSGQTPARDETQSRDGSQTGAESQSRDETRSRDEVQR